jgi:hypothetical protein
MACGLAVAIILRLLDDKPFRRSDRLNTEIVVPGAGYAHEALRHPYQTVKSLTETDGNDPVLAMGPLQIDLVGGCWANPIPDIPGSRESGAAASIERAPPQVTYCLLGCR